MIDFSEKNITQAVLDRFGNTPDPRLKTIIDSLVRHMHAFVRDTEISFDEWKFAIDFLTRTGHMCDGNRQEFILLSDTLGISMLVDAINHRLPAGATETTVLGPFYVENPPEFPMGFDVSRGLRGEKMFVEGTVSSAGGGEAPLSGAPLPGAKLPGAALPGATIDIWQSDSDGYYDVQRTDLPEPTLRGRFRADAQGRFHFWSILPQPYPIPHDGPVGQMLEATARHPWRPAHLHFMISAPGHEMLITHIFVQNDPYLESDAVFGVKKSLIGNYTTEVPGVAPDGTRVDTPWRKLSQPFALKPLAG